MATFTPISRVGEFGLINLIKNITDIQTDSPNLKSDLLMGISDDAAVFKPTADKVQIFTTDAMVEGVHFDLTYSSMQHLGWKAMASNISDIAAMGGEPRYALITLCLPQKISVEMVEEFYTGAVFACKKYNTLIAGGDTTAASGNMVISVSLIGEADSQKLVYRNGAKVGDLVCVSGTLGTSHAGLKVLMREKRNFLEKSESFSPNLEPYKPALEKYLMPKPRLDIAKLLTNEVKINSLIDVSDGLASEVHHICRNSGVGAEIWEHNIPIDNIGRNIAEEFSENIIDYALYGGEEYELLFTLTDENYAKLEILTSDVTILGRIVDASKGIYFILEQGEREELTPRGWDHFKENN